MFVHPSKQQIESYSGRRLSADESATVNEHLSGCEACYQQFIASLASKIKFPVEIDPCQWGSFREEHLLDEEVEDYVESRLQDYEFRRANLHIRLCPRCKHDVQSFAEIRDSINRSLARRYAPVKGPSVLQKYHSSFIHWSPPIPARIAFLILLTLIPAVVLWSALRAGDQGRQATAARPAEGESLLPAPIPQVSSPALSRQPGTGTRPGGRSIRESFDSGFTASPDKSRSSRQEIESALISKDVVMPPVIEAFDRLAPVARSADKNDDSFTALRPFSTVISEDQPTFRWTALSGAATYTVSLYDANLHLVKTSGPLTETWWLVPEPLRRGPVYTWTVRAIKDGKEVFAPGPPTRAEFKIIEESELIKLHYRIKGIISHAARGILFAQVGLLDEAETEFQNHLALRPADGRAKKLLETIRSWRGIESYPPPSPTTTKPAQ
jgi:hypothetical protein